MEDWKNWHAFVAFLLAVGGLTVGATPALPQVHISPVASPGPGRGQQATFSDPFVY
jgi:hypothetical protein